MTDTSELSVRVAEWQAARPAATGVFESDAAALERHVRTVDALLAELPAKPRRDATQQGIADTLHQERRRSREEFSSRWTRRIYDELTGVRTRHPRLDQVLAAAARRFPGALPDDATLAAEARRSQAAKEGYEIDQAVFVRAVLRDPMAGEHLLHAMRLPTARATALLPELQATGLVKLPTVRVERRGKIAHLTIDNPRHLNAEDSALVADLECAGDLSLLADRTAVMLLRGAVMTHPRYQGRRVFSAGIDLADLQAGRLPFVGFLMDRELGLVSKLMHGLAEPGPSKPWVAAVDTFAIGGGMQLLLVADRVMAADDAYFSLPAAEEGIVPGAANLRLGRFAGARLARRILLGGERIAATSPAAELICDEVVPVAELGRAAEAAARELAGPAVAANRRMLALAEEPVDRLRAYLAEFAYVQAHRLYSADVLARVERFAARATTRP